VARASTAGLDFGAMATYARAVGGPSLRAMTFHQRADRLKALALYLSEHKDPLYALAADTGATKGDNLIDIDGGIGTLFAYASRGRRELPNEHVVVEGPPEALSKGGTFVGAHVMTPLEGVAVHINAFNFPCWGMLEKLAPAFLAGVPVITKPATATAYVAEAVVRRIIESGLLPDGALQLICGSTGDLLDHLTGQDIVSFTGSIETSEKLQPPVDLAAGGAFHRRTRFAERRGARSDAVEGTPEFDLFVKEVAREMTVKAGQKCTAIRRVFVPRALEPAVTTALGARVWPAPRWAIRAPRVCAWGRSPAAPSGRRCSKRSPRSRRKRRWSTAASPWPTTRSTPRSPAARSSRRCCCAARVHSPAATCTPPKPLVRSPR
jgi:oxepin-CoA hydrolase/3-oxo-5,6-dehydrosuberyl-CoA semialdehyde dehydrogenase